MATEYDNVSDELDALINGSADILDTDEDTDYTEDSDVGSDTNEQIDGDAEDTDEDELDTDGENTLADDDNFDDTDDGENEDDQDTDENTEDTDDESSSTDDVKEDTTDTTDKDDGADQDTEVIDYQKEYQRLLDESKEAIEFRDKVAGAKFKANGKEVTGFSDPEKLIQAQQLAYNYSAKMAGFKQYRPFMAPLKDRGILDNPEKFDLAMKIIDGDPEAIKKQMQSLDIDPLDLDMDKVDYAPDNVRSTESMLAIEDALDQAKMYGVGDKVYEAVVEKWDDDSFKEFVESPSVQKDLITHMNNGSYEPIMQKVSEMSMLDNQFDSMKMTDKYRAAVAQMNAETQQAKGNTEGKVETPVEVDNNELSTIQAAKAELEREREAFAAEKAKAQKNDSAKQARDKASAVSRKKVTSKTKNSNVVDPLSLDGKGIESLLDSMIMSK